MKRNSGNQNMPTLNMRSVPGLETAIATWYAAHHAFKEKRCKKNQDNYCKAVDELGQAFSRWGAVQPEFFEQLRFWFESH